ncbi:MAG: TonB-dependent receptor [Pseudomonadales bacterium]|nr:TonB-dependent receptor [Pseudomonadales bacterium]
MSRNANGDPTPLIFANTDAEFTGADMTLGFRINDNFRAEILYSTVDGEREDISDNLYRINPDNLRAALYYDGANFNAKIEQVVVFDQDDISLTNTLDPTNPNNNANGTDSYNLTNAFFNWALDNGLSFSAGVENLFDEEFIDHLTGFNRVLNSVVPQGSRMIGPGRNVFGRMQYRW